MHVGIVRYRQSDDAGIVNKYLVVVSFSDLCVIFLNP
jgi:hypothetical protein